MTITRTQHDKTLIITVAGKLDTANAPLLDEEIRKGLDGAEELYWDFSDLEFITSAGIRCILKAHSMLKEGGTTKIVHANESVRNALYLTGMTELLG